jgi:hypothetical protein
MVAQFVNVSFYFLQNILELEEQFLIDGRAVKESIKKMCATKYASIHTHYLRPTGFK